MYSFGIVMWELITREEPYDGQGGVQIAYAAAEQGLRPPIPNFCPDDFSKLMQECWAEKPTGRPDFGEVLERLFQMMKATLQLHACFARQLAAVALCLLLGTPLLPTISPAGHPLPTR